MPKPIQIFPSSSIAQGLFALLDDGSIYMLEYTGKKEWTRIKDGPWKGSELQKGPEQCTMETNAQIAKS